MCYAFGKRFGGSTMSEPLCGLPTPEQAEELLQEAAASNPGPWEAHSRNAAEAARRIAERCPGMDAQAAHTKALLHDIGRRYGVTGMRHALDGYRYLMELGFDQAARACMLHSFPLPGMDAAFGVWDCTAEEFAFVENYIQTAVFDDYDRLIQICDALADASGFCLMEKRFIDVAIRHGVMEKAPLKWTAWLQTKAYFEEKMGCSIYSVLPGVAEGTFGKGWQNVE
jgi:hypothetical protein